MTESGALVFGNRWVVKGTIGKGAFSEIYAAEDLTGENGSDLVAIKFHNAEFDSSVMKWEGIVMADLAHIPYVPDLIYYGNEFERDYLVMELLSGEDMAQLRDRTRLNVNSKLIPVEIVSYLTRQMIQCLEPMHKKGYVHRDVKPSNFVRRSAQSTEFCIIDFGLAKQHRDPQGKIRPEREHVEFRGTTIYASPYVHLGNDQCPRDDMFSVLHVFLDLALGDLPWRMQAISKDKADVAAMKARLLQNPAQFLEDYVHWQETIVQADKQHVTELKDVVAAISETVCSFVRHLKTLSYSDYPSYGVLRELLHQACPGGVADQTISSLSYSGYGFDWNGGRNLQEVMASFHAQAQGTASKSRRSFDACDTRDRLSVEHFEGLDVAAGRVRSSSSANVVNFSSKRRKTLRCTACPARSNAEMIHPHLRVSICGACSAALKDADMAMMNDQIHSCAWCGNADDLNLFMCDSCPRSFCEECIARNFGTAESEHVKSLDLWACYVCIPTLKLKSLQVDGDIEYFNIDRAYNSVRPPNVQEVSSQSIKVYESLTPEERNFVAVFSGSVGGRTIQDPELIGQFLTAADNAVVLRVSSGVRKYFQSTVSYTPGLFKTNHARKRTSSLFGHQMVSLNYMTHMENSRHDFGALRGGIFGDEPGLGKTITVLALVTSTAGLMPQHPAVFWNKNTIDEQWVLHKGRYDQLLGPVLNTIQMCPVMTNHHSENLLHLRVNIENLCNSVSAFESAVYQAIRTDVPSRDDRIQVLSIFRQEMVRVKESLDPRLRKYSFAIHPTPSQLRVMVERALSPSCATLIVVPLTLLEHWYAQIKQHMNLCYHSCEGFNSIKSGSMVRGVVYFYGLGDMIDLKLPLTNLHASTRGTVNQTELSQYLIVVTTFERCAEEYKTLTANGKAINALSHIPLLKVRWLRLVVDEGHILGKSSERKSDPVCSFISQIAAERRWVMSGTPTTGSKSDVALDQLYRLLQFLRHPRLVNSGGSGAVVKVENSGKSEKNGNSEVVGGKRKASSLTTTTASTTTTTISASDTDFISPDRWNREVILPCLAQRPEAWQSVVDLLKTVLLRHTKNDIHLFEPIRSTTNLELGIPISELQAMTADERTVAIDQCKANYIADTMLRAKQEYRNFLRSNGGSSVSEARRRSILNRMNHSRLSNGGEGGAKGSSSSATADASTSSNGASTSTSSGVAKKVFTLAELMAKKSKNNTTNSSGTNGMDRAMTGAQSSIGSTIGTNANTNSTTSSVVVPTAASINRKMLEVTDEEKELCRRVRVPKAIVFSLDHWQLQGVGHNLILRLGLGSICEHFGTFRSSELSRFRHSKKKFRQCPMCGYCNQITTGNACSQYLLLVEYTNSTWLNPEADNTNNSTNNPTSMYPAEPAGHGRAGPGGHYTGKCLCSPEGCVPPPEHTLNTSWSCGGLPNPFYKAELVLPEHFNHAIVSYEHIDGYVMGRTFNIGDHVFVRRQNACALGGAVQSNISSSSENPQLSVPTSAGQLWRGGVLGGHAIVRGWRQCGGKANVANWHGDKILAQVPWRTEHEDASILLLEEDGSTGLDLSFATHIFLLNRIKDPALRNQIVSRAHRMGALGPVKVELVQVALEDGDGVE